MSLQKISAANSISFRANETKNNTEKTINSKETKDNKKKLGLTLAGLAIMGAAAVGIALYLKKGKVSQELPIDEFRKIGNFDKGIAYVKGKPYTGTIEVLNKKGKYQLKYTNGVLESSTKSVDISDKGWREANKELAKRLDEIGLPDLKFIPVTKKVYKEQNGAKIVEKYIKEDSETWNLLRKTTTEDGKVTIERNTLFGTLKDIATKQKDGSWEKTIQEVQPDKKDKRSYNIVTKNAKNNEIISEETFKYNVQENSNNRPLTPEEREVFTL